MRILKLNCDLEYCLNYVFSDSVYKVNIWESKNVESPLS